MTRLSSRALGSEPAMTPGPSLAVAEKRGKSFPPSFCPSCLLLK
jgi:hypothetical protein